MSRTYRRKQGIKEDQWWVLREWYCGLYVVRHSPRSKEGKKRLAKYHSDAEVTMQQVPKWYKVAFCRRPFRRKEKQALYRAVFHGEDKFPVPKNDAMYYW